jgi:hypothetical protein
MNLNYYVVEISGVSRRATIVVMWWVFFNFCTVYYD